MTITERNKKLKYLITCMKCEVSGKCCDENCPTQYDAGNMGEIIENLEAISKALEQEPCSNCCNGNQIEKAKLCQKSYLAGMEHKQEPSEDCISREELLEQIYIWGGDTDTLIEYIKGMPSVTPQEPILDKIRAEIEQTIGERNLDDYDFCSGLICARNIIDKCKTESEGKSRYGRNRTSN